MTIKMGWLPLETEEIVLKAVSYTHLDVYKRQALLCYESFLWDSMVQSFTIP